MGDSRWFFGLKIAKIVSCPDDKGELKNGLKVILYKSYITRLRDYQNN